MIKFKSRLIIASNKYPATFINAEVLRMSKIAYPSDLENLIVPNFPKDKGVIISGSIPVWLMCGISEALINYAWKATFDPDSKGAIVTATASLEAPKVGEWISIPKFDE